MKTQLSTLELEPVSLKSDPETHTLTVKPEPPIWDPDGGYFEVAVSSKDLQNFELKDQVLFRDCLGVWLAEGTPGFVLLFRNVG